MYVLAHPTLNDLTPPEFVRIAARTGYDAVNLRIMPLEPNDPAHDIFRDRGLLRATADALAETGLPVLDVEVIRIEPDSRAETFAGLFASAQTLGARYVVAIAMDTDEGRVTERLAELCAAAAPHELTVVLEFMMRGGIRTLDAAHRIVTGTGARNAGVLVDALHFYRTGSQPADLAAIDPARLPYMQINDVVDFERLRATALTDNSAWKKILPGKGELRLRELLAALPPGIPISIEAPGTPGMSVAEAERYARAALEATRAVVAGTANVS